LEKQQRYIHIDYNQRDAIRTRALSAIGSQFIEARQSAARAIAQIGVIELENAQWPEIIDILLHNAKQPDNHLKHGTLECLGYICEDIVRIRIPPLF